MKYLSAILTLMFSSFLTILILLYVGNISGKIEKDNSLLKKRIIEVRKKLKNIQKNKKNIN